MINMIFRPLLRLQRIMRRRYWTWRVRRQVQKITGRLTVNARSSVGPNVFLADNVNFNGMQISGMGKVIIGNNFHSGIDCLMITQNHNYDHGAQIPYDSSYILKDIVIEDNVWLGDRVIVLGGVTIGEGAIVQAGSVVVKSIPKYAIAGGHPAQVFGQRNIEHYEKLKHERQFH